ncbi:MAG: hypothetical protein ACLGIN_10885 [Candidatus Sericytochromatia bacterium]
MEPQPKDNPAEGARGGTAPLTGSEYARSSLSLPGGAASAPAGGTARKAAPTISLQEGVSRAGNIAHAAMMIVLLLGRYFFVKVIGTQLYWMFVRFMLVVGQVVEVVWRIAAPRLARLRKRAAETGNKALKLALTVVITLLVPLERIASLMIKGAKTHGARLATQSALSTVQVLAPLLAGIGQVIQAGFKKAVVRKVMLRLIAILEEAQR